MTTVLIIVLSFVSAGLGYLLYTKNNDASSALSKSEIEKRVKEEIEAVKKQKQEMLDEYKEEIKKKYEEKEELLEEKLESKNEIALEKMKLDQQQKLKKEGDRMREEILNLQVSLEKREGLLDQKIEEVETKKNELIKQEEDLEKELEKLKKEEEKVKKDLVKQLEKASKLTLKEAKKQIMATAKDEVGQDLLTWQGKYLEEVREEASEEARQIVALAVERCSSEVSNELTVTNIKLDNEEDKGKIIGKQGRNIQWLEKTLGVEFVIDETPGVVTISGFNSVRRHVAKKTLEKLLGDGRIHPSSIEEMYKKAKAEVAKDVAEAGEKAVRELGIFDFPPKLVRLIGRLKFRSSYGQNMLKHSVEMAKLAKLIAEEMNEKFLAEKPVDVEICIKGALLHDIGKAIDEETQPKGDHVTLGEKVCDVFGLDWRIKKSITSHHTTGGDVQSYEDKDHGFCLEAAIVDACDNISGGRIGARKESAEAYYQRMDAMEKIAENTKGVTKSWIMRGSRELWVFFDTEAVTPAEMHDIIKDLTKKIQTGVSYPGEIKIVGLWEDKIVEYAH